MAQRPHVPAYMVLSDSALEDLCRKRPANLRELLSVTGIGERKAELYGSEIFAAFEAFQKALAPPPAKPRRLRPPMRPSASWPRARLSKRSRNSAAARPSTVVNMVADLIEKGRIEYRVEWVGEEDHALIADAIAQLGSQWLKPLRDALPERIGYDQIRLGVAWARSRAAAISQ